MLAPPTTAGTRKLSDVARHLVLPSGIVSTGYGEVQQKLKSLDVEHDDWQQGLGRAVLAKRADGLYAAGIGGVVLSTCRQVGKTFTFGTIIFALCLLQPGTTVLWTAHHSRTSDETFEALAGLARMPRFAAHTKVLSGNGHQVIKFTNGSRILFGAREHGFGRGIPGVSIIVFDEAQILSQRAKNAMLPSVNTTRNPLIIYMGTPPDPRDQSETFKWMRRRALDFKRNAAAAELLELEIDVLYIEIGADPGADIDDREEWAKGNPSYPYRTPDEAFLRLRAQLGDDDAFRREGLGIWDEDQTSTPRAISADLWKATEVTSAPEPGLRRGLGVAFSLDGARLSIAGASIADDEDAIAFAELIDAYSGSMDSGLGPLADWMAERWRSYSGFVLAGRAGATVLENLLLKRKVPQRRILVTNTPQFLKAVANHLDEIRAKTVTHLVAEGQTALDEAVKVTDKRNRTVDGGWSWTSPDGEYVHVEAISLALYGARTLPAPRRVTTDKPKGRIL